MLTPEGFREVFLAAPDGVLVVSRDGIIRDINPAAERIFGYGPGELLGGSVDSLVPESFRGRHEEHRDRYARAPHARPMGAGLELEGRRRDGSTFPVEISLSSWDREGAASMVVCTVRDVTERQRLRDFSRGALQSVEVERKRIARELHDDTAQRLATLLLRLALLDGADEVERSELMEGFRDDLVEAVEGIRRIARGLRPPELEDLGLVTALQAHIRGLRDASGFEVSMELGDVEEVLDMDTKLVLYRIVQESLSNAVRHSGAASATVSMTVEEDMVRAVVRDEGRGFGAPGPSQSTGMGIMGMNERAQMMGGRLTVLSSPGQGTTVEVLLPALVPGAVCG